MILPNSDQTWPLPLRPVRGPLVAPVMIYVSNQDKPGFIGRFASLLGNAAINIATFALGRDREGGSAIALVEVDGPVPEKVLAEIATLPGVKEVKALHF